MSIEKYKSDLTELVNLGDSLQHAMEYECRREFIEQSLNEMTGDEKAKAKKIIDGLPNFNNEYQQWYSECLTLVKVILPDRLKDFVRQYERPTTRKNVDAVTYVIEDYLSGLKTTRGLDEIAGPSDAISKFRQQLNILKACSRRFESTLFDIKQLVQADLFDSELDAARELHRNNYLRAAGVVAGVVLEKHLGHVCDSHNISIRKKHPTISDFNDLLKDNNVIEIAQ